MCSKPPSNTNSNSHSNPHDLGLSKFLSNKPTRAVSRRLALWDIDGSMHCSIIGTCLTEQDLVAALRRNNLQAASHAHSYDIHSYCVRAASQDTPLTRSINKLLDRRFEGAVRLVGRTEGGAELRAIWERLRNGGQIGAGYWALLSHRHVPTDLKISMFGEVHMLSHLNGHGAQELSVRLADAERRIADLESRLRRSEQAKAEALAERDAARQECVRKRSDWESETPGRGADDRSRPGDARLAKAERALISARARARHAEELLANSVATAQAEKRLRALAPSPVAAKPCPPPIAAASSAQRLRILYLGGRPAIVPHLREAADVRQAELLHHDGGVDDNMHRIEELIQSCDVVMCPIDCISHGACRLAKDTCQRFQKRFMPIATSSRSGFERALAQVSDRRIDTGPAAEARRRP